MAVGPLPQPHGSTPSPSPSVFWLLAATVPPLLRLLRRPGRGPLPGPPLPDSRAPPQRLLRAVCGRQGSLRSLSGLSPPIANMAWVCLQVKLKIVSGEPYLLNSRKLFCSRGSFMQRNFEQVIVLNSWVPGIYFADVSPFSFECCPQISIMGKLLFRNGAKLLVF